MLEEHNAEVVLLTCCRNTEDPPSWNSSEPFVARPPRSFCGIGGFSYSFTQDYVVSLLEKIFLLLSPPFREPEGQRNKHCCRERWGLQCRIHRIGNLQKWSGHRDDISHVNLQLWGGFILSFTSSSAETWFLEQWEQACLGRYFTARVTATTKVIMMILEAVMTL